jgi:hypothetical protein
MFGLTTAMRAEMVSWWMKSLKTSKRNEKGKRGEFL